MRKLFALGSLAALALTASACGPENRQYCVDACKEAQARECLPDTLDLDCEADITCPASWDESSIDYTEYVDCVYSQYQCTANGAYEFVDANCKPPTDA